MDLLVNIDVDDLQKAIDFYGAAFGLRIGRRFGAHGAEMLGAAAPIYLLVKAAGSGAAKGLAQPRSYARHWTPLHLDFAVADLDAALARAVAVGAVLEDPPETHRWGRIAHLADPFGHGFCLLQFLGRGYDEVADPV
jgi:predicted enzyme related to lactoylglutathione lyase